MNKELKIGDVVVLKSGSPKMTIKYINELKTTYCSWFNPNLCGGFTGEVNVASFDLDQLKRYEQPTSN